MRDIEEEMRCARKEARELERLAADISQDVESLCSFLEDAQRKKNNKDAGVIKLVGSRWSHTLGGGLEQRVIRVIEEHVEEQIEKLERLTRRE